MYILSSADSFKCKREDRLGHRENELHPDDLKLNCSIERFWGEKIVKQHKYICFHLCCVC